VTPREAIIELNRYIGTERVSINEDKMKQALRLAIKALKLMIEIEEKGNNV
jgi:hypothetical protein